MTIGKKWRTTRGLFVQTYNEWMEDKAPRLGASLAFYSALSLGPLLLLALSVASLVFGREAATGQIVSEMGGMIGKQGAETVQGILAAAASDPDAGIIGTIVGVITLLLGASGVFGELQDALNTIWEVKPKSGRGILGVIKDRFLSMTMVLGTAFMLLTSLVFSAGLTAAGKYTGGLVPAFAAVMEGVNFIISFGVITLLFGLIFKILPDAQMKWSDVWIGAAITSLLFVIGKFAISLYLGHSSLASSYGTAGSLIVVLVWVYYSAQILFFGAEFTQVYANKIGSRIRPAPDAEPTTEEGGAQQGLTRRA